MPSVTTKPTVLIVEDEALQRRSAVEMVEEAGFHAIEARDGAEAMDLLETVPDIRAVLTDVDMPASIDGIKLAACIHRKWPAIAIVLISGKVVPRLGDVPTGARFFSKPYQEEELVAVLRNLVTA